MDFKIKDRFKFRIWDKKLNKLSKWGDNPYHNMEIMNYICVEEPVTDWKHEDYILMQCTGLKDKNGKLIYEGDIVKIHQKTYSVIFDNRTAYFGLKISNVETNTLNNIDTQVDILEVIGNIYENSKLLEDGGV